MTKYIEYEYAGENEKPDIQPIAEFNIYTVHLPANVIGFRFLEAKNETEAAQVKFEDKQVFYLAEPEDIFYTEDVRNFGAQMNLDIDDFNRVFNEKVSVDAPSETSVDTIDQMLENFASPNSAGQVMTNFVVDFLEQNGCHRTLGDPLLYGQGINDRATILDKNTRAIISPPYFKG